MTRQLPDPIRHAPTAKGEARRERLLDAAADAFLSRGYAGTSTQMIVGEAGGSVATLYQMFGNKEGLLIAVLQREFERMQTRVFPATLYELPIDQALYAIAYELLAYSGLPRSVDLYRLLLAEAPRVERITEYLGRQLASQLYDPLECCLRQACERGELSIDEPARAARMLGTLIQGVSHDVRLAGGYPDGPSDEDVATCQYGIDAFLRAFRA